MMRNACGTHSGLIVSRECAPLDTATGAPTSGPARPRQRPIKAGSEMSETGAPLRLFPLVAASRYARRESASSISWRGGLPDCESPLTRRLLASNDLKPSEWSAAALRQVFD